MSIFLNLVWLDAVHCKRSTRKPEARSLPIEYLFLKLNNTHTHTFCLQSWLHLLGKNKRHQKKKPSKSSKSGDSIVDDGERALIDENARLRLKVEELERHLRAAKRDLAKTENRVWELETSLRTFKLLSIRKP